MTPKAVVLMCLAVAWGLRAGASIAVAFYRKSVTGRRYSRDVRRVAFETFSAGVLMLLAVWG